MKQRGERSAWLTAYDAAFAEILGRAGVDGLLVGDSVGQVFAGFGTTLPVTLEQMIYHGGAVVRGAPESFVVVDLPFLTYQTSVRDAVWNAGRVLKETGAAAVKLEGGRAFARTVRRLVRGSIPTMGHLGLLPQSVRALGGYPLQGADEAAATALRDDAQALQDAGCFAIVLEKVPAPVARAISETLEIPAIGIGAGAGCDGQILVLYDLLGLTGRFRPRFVRRYAELGQDAGRAVHAYVRDVKDGSFPSEAESYEAP
ncbi:MAG: 3-methyl-2-oxobutanoate hydroxymethyltransferase [Gemmatimonadetes bacterium]|nr:3-methyl-2-oxobutanoate hydroxymethyltransferase [Gemmatimonadota bacterium]